MHIKMDKGRKRVDKRSTKQIDSFFAFVIILVAILFDGHVVEGAHSRRRIVVRREAEPRYDRSITTFSEDGRLAQVEYGMEASFRGSSIAAIKIDDGICLTIQNASFGKVHRLDHHIWLATAGLSGDARILANALRGACQNFRSSTGEAPTTKQVARMAGDLQHELTRTGGARPLGCTAIVAGIDPTFDEESIGTPKLYQTDPGGIVEECTFCAAGKGRSNVGKVLGSLTIGITKKRTSSSDDKQVLNYVAADMAKKVLGQLDDPQGEPSVDVWTLQPNPGRRGGVQASCYRNISKHSIPRIRDQQLQDSKENSRR